MTDNEHRAYGRHSRIPECCIEFWLGEWQTVFREDGNGWKHPYARAVHTAKWGYVPCPECFGDGYKVKIKICAKECGGEHRKDFENIP